MKHVLAKKSLKKSFESSALSSQVVSICDVIVWWSAASFLGYISFLFFFKSSMKFVKNEIIQAYICFAELRLDIQGPVSMIEALG